MSSFATERPLFFEGQYLGADDLTAIINYVRIHLARENLGHHTWGIVAGLDIVSQPVTDTAVEYFVQPGVAVDGYGRIIVVTSPARIAAEQFVSMGSGNITVWIRYDQGEFFATRPGFQICSATDTYARMNETFALEVGEKKSILERQSGITVNEQLLTDARDTLISLNTSAALLTDASVPYQQLPVDDEASYWLIPLGQVRWSATDNNFLPLIDPADAEALANGTGTKSADEILEADIRSRNKRIYSGAIVESVYANDGLIRLRERTLPPEAGKTNDQLVNAQNVKNSDYIFCDNQLKKRELIWLEGSARITGDFRLFDKRIEFRNADGRDYVARTINGVAVPASAPLLIQRNDGNAKGGADLQILLGESENGTNRLAIGNISFEDENLCSRGKPPVNKIVIQDNGRVGIGTIAPDTNLLAPLTLRGFVDELIINEDTADEETISVQRLLNLEANGGALTWQMNLWSDNQSLSIHESTAATAHLYLQTGGNLGIGTREPGAKVDIREVATTVNGSPLGQDIWLRVGDGGDDGRVWIEYGPAGAPLLVLSDRDNPPRIQFQQTNSADIEAEKSPAFASWLGHANNNTANIALIGGFFGIATQQPLAPLTVQGNGGSTHFYSGQHAGHVWLGFYTDGVPGTARAGWIGYGNDGNLDFTIANEKINGDIVLQPQRNVGIGTNDPGAKLDVRGDIRLGSNGEYFAMTAATRMHTVAGRVNSGGGVSQGSGFTPQRLSEGHYQIIFTPAFAAAPIVVACAFNHEDNIVSVMSSNASSCVVRCRDVEGSNIGPQDIDFNFIAIGLR